MVAEVDVAVVGAGAAGLAATRSLLQAGFSVTLLEADSRSGGRAHTETMRDGSPFDLGCHWLHSASINPFVVIADQLGCRYQKHAVSGRYVRGGRWLPEAEAATLEQALIDYKGAMAAAWSRGEDISVFEAIDRNSPWTPVLDYFTALNTSAEVDQVSIGDILNYQDTEEDWPVSDGYGELVARWATGIPVQLNTAVQQIRWDGAGVAVETVRGTLTASRIIVAVSTGVLAAGQIRFVPELPGSKLAAIAALPLGNYNRIRLEIDRHLFADDLPERIVVEHGELSPMSLALRPYQQDCVVGMVAGRYADWLERAGPEASRQAVIDSLCQALGNDMAKHVRGDRQSAWRGNPFVLGAYSASAPGQFHQRAVLAGPLNERLFFCGEATSTNQFCTCHGAKITGERAATEVAASLGITSRLH
ncbi:MAG TPA: hypothetical protein DG414_00935 [Gammaproteobacteria bacterium]|jgi:monoamine oxidase|nr:hypothetical protein [Gammaproteobacteria bacterium]